MVDARLIDGADLPGTIDAMTSISAVERIHVHNAGAGCFAAAAIPTPDVR